MAQYIEDQEMTTQKKQRKTASFLAYVPALLVALVKDLLDLVLLGSLPGIGTILTFVFSLVIFLLLMIPGSSGSYRTRKKGVMLLGGTLIEGVFFGLNFLPIETLTVLAIYMVEKKAR